MFCFSSFLKFIVVFQKNANVSIAPAPGAHVGQRTAAFPTLLLQRNSGRRPAIHAQVAALGWPHFFRQAAVGLIIM